MPLNPALSDHARAVQDALLLRAGVIKPTAAVHPAAEDLLERDSNLLRALAEVYGAAAVRPGATSPLAAMGAGLQSADFAEAIAGTLRRAAMIKLSGQTTHRLFCDQAPVRDFKPREFLSVDVNLDLVEGTENSEYGSPINVSAGPGVVASLGRFGRNLMITREALLNDDFDMLAGIVGNFGASAGRLEAKLVCDLLESNPVLGDALPLFDAAHGNVVSLELGAASLGQAIGQLRTIKTPGGELSNAEAAFLVVAPELELLAHSLLTAAGLQDQVRVVALAWLPAGRWYVMADPSQASVVGLLDLKGGSFVIGRRGNPKQSDTLQLGVRYNPGVVPLGRLGAVRGGV